MGHPVVVLNHAQTHLIKRVPLTTLPHSRASQPSWTGHWRVGDHTLNCPASSRSDAEMYKRLTFLSLIPVPVLQQAAWLSLGFEERQPGALFYFLMYAWPLYVRQEFVAEESFRIPFVVTFIISFAHLQHELYANGKHPLIQLFQTATGCQQEGTEDTVEKEVLRIEKQKEKEDAEDKATFDKRLALRGLRVVELMKLAREHNVKGRSKMRKADLVAHLEGANGIMKKLEKIRAPS